MTAQHHRIGAFAGLVAVAMITTCTAQARDRTVEKIASASDVTGSVNPRRSSDPQRTAALKAYFEISRTALDRAMLLRDSGKTDVAAFKAAMQRLSAELGLLERAAPRSAEPVRKAARLAREWYEAGMLVVAPPASGVTELPTTVALAAKADAVAAAIDQIGEPAPVAQRVRPRQPTKRTTAVDPGGGFLGIFPFFGPTSSQ